MANSSHLICNDFPFQVSRPCMFLSYRDVLMSASKAPEPIPLTVPKKLTEEAANMIYIMLVFIGLAVLGSSITAYEFFFKGKEKKSESHQNGHHNGYINGCSNNNTNGVLKKRKPTERNDFLQDCKPFLKCFCIVRNGRNILSTSSADGQIDCIQGLRFLVNIVIIGFHFLPLYIGVIRNLKDLKPLLSLKVSQLGLNAMFTVDVFFVISGFLNAHAFFYRYSRSGLDKSWLSYIFKRYLRLTPVYMIVLGFYTTLYSYTGTGALWPSYDTVPVCRKNWWKHLLYINNFENSYKQCLEWCWSLAADMQFYIISPIFMISLFRWPKFGFALILACICGSSIISFIISYKYNLIDGLSRMDIHIDDVNALTIKFWLYFEVLHIKPYTRISSYLVAIVLAYYLHKRNSNKITTADSSMTLYCGWIITTVIMWICFFPIFLGEDTRVVTALYNSTKNFIFSCGLSWIIYLCLTGQLEFLNKFLSWKFFLPLSRLSYCAYLIHPLILTKICLQARDFVDFGYVSMLSLYLYIVGYTYFLAFFTSLFFEVPMLNLLDLFYKKKVKKVPNSTHLD